MRGERVAVLYLPYLSGFDREPRVLRRAFRDEVSRIVRGVAEFNGHNVLDGRAAARFPASPHVARRPSLHALRERLGVTDDRARALQRSWEAVYERWSVVESRTARLPTAIAHGDVSPGNVGNCGEVTRFIDLGLAVPRPLGSDLASVVRWTFHAMGDDGHEERLLGTYLDALPDGIGPIDPEDVRLALWATYFRRYTNLTTRHARHLGSFELALGRIDELLGRRGSS